MCVFGVYFFQFFLIFERSSEKFLAKHQSEKDCLFLKGFQDLPGIVVKHSLLVPFFTCTVRV